MSMFNDIVWGSEDNERECDANAALVSVFATRFPAGRWSFFGPGSEKKWYCTYIDRPQGEWDRIAELMMIKNLENADTQFSDPRVHCPEERSKEKEMENYQYTFALIGIRLKLFFAQLFLSISSVSTDQSQICVKNTVAVKQEQGDLLLQSNLIHFSRQQVC